MKRLLSLLFVFGSLVSFSQTKILPSEVQISMATLASPEMYRDEATVLGYNEKGALVTLREGTNGLVCLADDPNKEGISVACYAVELEPYRSEERRVGKECRSQL